MFGTAMETYKGGGKALVFAVILALIVRWFVRIALSDSTPMTPVDWVVSLAAVGAVAWIFYWLLSIRVSLHPEGIVYQSCLGSKEMRWEEVEKFYYSATRQRVNFIPVGTYYTYKLVGAGGKKISFGNRIARAGEAGTRLIELTGKPLFQFLADLYNSGAELDFGPIKLQRERGFRMKRHFRRWQELPLNQVASYRIESGNVYIFKVGQKYSGGFAISQVPNAFVYLALLDAIYQPAA